MSNLSEIFFAKKFNSEGRLSLGMMGWGALADKSMESLRPAALEVESTECDAS